MDMLGEIFNVVAPIFVCCGIGFFWVKNGFDYDTSLITRLVTNIGFPCLIFSVMSKSEMTEEIFEEMSIAAFVSVVIFFALGATFLKTLKLSQLAYLPSLALANTGNMGLPLCLFSFGSTGLAYGFAYFWVQILMVFCLGSTMAAKSLNFKIILRLPLIWAIAVAFVFNYFDFKLPSGFNNTVKLLGDFAIPLCLITLGASLADLKINSIKHSVIFSFFRLSSGFLIGVLLSELLGFDGVVRGVLIIMCSMPSAVFNYLFAELYHNQPQEIAGIVLISTICSFATLPLLLWFVM